MSFNSEPWDSSFPFNFDSLNEARSFLPFPNRESIILHLRRYLSDFHAMQAMRRYLYDRGAFNINRMNDHAIIEQMTTHLMQHQLVPQATNQPDVGKTIASAEAVLPPSDQRQARTIDTSIPSLTPLGFSNNLPKPPADRPEPPADKNETSDGGTAAEVEADDADDVLDNLSQEKWLEFFEIQMGATKSVSLEGNEELESLREQLTQAQDGSVQQAVIQQQINQIERGYESRFPSYYKDILGDEFFPTIDQCDERHHLIEVGPGRNESFEAGYFDNEGIAGVRLIQEGLLTPKDNTHKARITGIGTEMKAESYIESNIAGGKYHYIQGDINKLPPGTAEPADIVFDSFAAITYTDDLATTLKSELELLKTGGKLFTHLESDPRCYTKIVDCSGPQEKDAIEAWLNAIRGAKVTIKKVKSPGSNLDRYELLFERTDEEIYVPPLSLDPDHGYLPGDPPRRKFISVTSLD